jgi:hypothetical protein
MSVGQYILTPEEQAKLEWCYSILSEEQIVECYDNASECAIPESLQVEAAEFLETLFATIIINSSHS